MKARRPTAVALFLLFCLITALGVSAFTDEGSGRVYNALEKAFYLSAQDSVWIYPGLNLSIQNVTIPTDRKVVVTFKVTDDKGQGLDREGLITPGSVSTSWILAYLPANQDQYVAYTVRPATGSVSGTVNQASTDQGGKYASLGNGTYTYTFATALPANYDVTATHTVGVYSTRNLTEFGLSNYVANELFNWVPSGAQVTHVRDVVADAACNQCHDPLAAHGGSRQKVEICNLCHTPQTIDPDTGNTVDMKVMTHKIHNGANLSKPYIIIGRNGSVHDYSEVTYPQDILNCTTCHKNTTQVNNWMLNPSRDTCGSCHDTIDWKTGANHAAGPQPDDLYCQLCHWPENGMEYDATVAGAHVAPYKSRQLRNPKFEFLQVSNTGPGQSPTVKFRVTDKTGTPINPATMGGTTGRFALTLAGPTSDYRWYLQEAANTATFDGDAGTFTFKGTIPPTAKGTYVVQAEGYVNTTINRGTQGSLIYRDAFDNVVKPFAVTGTVQERRTVVDLAKCNRCHDKLQLHGNNRNRIEACVVCHNPATTDSARRPASANPPESIDMQIMIHKIHTGAELANDYTVYGFGNVAINFNEVGYPGDRRNCLTCHVGTSFQVPLPPTATASTTPRSFWDPTLPTSAACLGCHDSVDAAAHAFVNTATFEDGAEEACPVCHEEGADFAVTKAHAR